MTSYLTSAEIWEFRTPSPSLSGAGVESGGPGMVRGDGRSGGVIPCGRDTEPCRPWLPIAMSLGKTGVEMGDVQRGGPVGSGKGGVPFAFTFDLSPSERRHVRRHAVLVGQNGHSVLKQEGVRQNQLVGDLRRICPGPAPKMCAVPFTVF